MMKVLKPGHLPPNVLSHTLLPGWVVVFLLISWLCIFFDCSTPWAFNLRFWNGNTCFVVLYFTISSTILTIWRLALGLKPHP